ncbi:double-strand break repair helicase AddA [Aureimonas populi]|uniref:DNA 3'-5' helicase n=1 Tax=Aureimonas populi TaxID=1701758 RepID=A0ABW5CS15_9HYPH|nr:double-strand break repair helicase AddA [Aureimonas populi]
MSALDISEGTRAAQERASDPARSVFVAANAGSGKTFVLACRVVRLLLSGAEPSRILCLTYTKAAAAEMQTRIFATLSQWTRASEEALAAELAQLGARPTPEALAAARRLFARALETPGGLKIQTIHAFCESLLHLFPLEAHVPGHFEVLDDAQSAMLLAEARRLLIVQASGEEADEGLAEAFAEALSLAGEAGLDRLIGECVSKRDRIRAHLGAAGGLDEAVGRLAKALDVRADETQESLLAPAFHPPGFDDAFAARLAEAARESGKPTDAKLLAKLSSLHAASQAPERFEALKALCLKADGGRYKTSSVATKAVTGAFADFEERLHALAGFVEETAERLSTLRLFRASRAALIIARKLEGDYQELKRRRGRLDFEDLIVRTADLLTRGEAAAWVHYKLDQGIDHVLVDEAQDTSPRQWEVVRSLVEEFFSSDDRKRRTMFAVGDEKQSIYSFQGASPAMFTAERRRLEAQAKAARADFSRVALQQSFRSTATVLAAVDKAFEAEEDRRGLSVENEKPVHVSARGAVPGLVEIWPPYVKQAARESDDWLDPIDTEPLSSPVNRLAMRIASTIEGWLGQPLEDRRGRRPLGPGDVIVLVRKRSAFVGAMSAALRDRHIPVAGADRLVITDHIAVQDLMALGRVVSNAEDELSLAEALKSPLFGFSDDDLMGLALSRRAERPEPLYFALRRLAAEGGAERLPAFVTDKAALAARAAAAFLRLEELRDRAGFEGVFTFYARLLGPEGARARLIARLGHDAGEVVDAFLDLACAHEADGKPDLDAFLATLASAPPTIKREMDQGRGEVRIMTAHAAKGLEAPVVFLVDPGSAPFVHTHGARLMEWEAMPGLAPGAAPGFLWCPEKALVTPVVETLREAERQRAEEEYRRLLYVGMTRAADRLVICGHAGTRGPHESSWLMRVQSSLGPDCEEVRDEAGELVAYRWGPAPAEAKLAGPTPAQAAASRVLDLSPLPAELRPPRPLVPSDPAGTLRIEMEEEPPRLGSPVLSGQPQASLAIRRGLLTHKLLQILPELPPQAREAAARRHLAVAAGEMSEAQREAILGAALAVLSHERFSALFSPGSRAEVGLRGTVEIAGRTYPVSGTIDRLAVSERSVLIVDYKTNRLPPATLDEVPAAYVTQLALYRALLMPLYPGRPVEAALLFTEAPRLIELPPAAMEEALAGLASRRGAA